jgi:hypothetical protein
MHRAARSPSRLVGEDDGRHPPTGAIHIHIGIEMTRTESKDSPTESCLLTVWAVEGEGLRNEAGGPQRLQAGGGDDGRHPHGPGQQEP